MVNIGIWDTIFVIVIKPATTDLGSTSAEQLLSTFTDDKVTAKNWNKSGECIQRQDYEFIVSITNTQQQLWQQRQLW